MQTLNEKIFYAFNNLAGQHEWLDAFIFFAAEYIGWLMLGGLIVYLFMHQHDHDTDAPKEKWEIFLETHLKLKAPARNILVILSSAVIAYVCAYIIKEIATSPRPFLVLAENEMTLLFKHGGYNSFPSGHTTFFAALAVSLTFFHKRLGALYLVGALLIGLTRIAGGVHWPIDILAGYALGGVVAWAVYSILKNTTK